MSPKTIGYIQFGIIIACIISFLPVFNADFVNYDDPDYVTGNNYIKKMSFENMKAIFMGKATILYVPLTICSYLIEFTLFGDNAKVFHVVNLAVHIINALLLFKILLRLNIRNNYQILLVLTFFSINPLVSESVCWITERKDVLYCLFYFLAILQFLNFRETKETKSLVLCFVLFCLSCLSKPMAVSLPVLFFIYTFYVSVKFNLKQVFYLIPFFIISVIFSVISIYTIGKNTQASDVLDHFNLTERVVLFFSELGFYFFKPFFPLRQQLIHLFPAQNKLMEHSALLVYAVLGLIMIITVLYFGFKNKNRRLLCLFFSWFIFLVPVLQFYPNTHSYVSERYFYVSIIFPLAILFQFLQPIKIKESSLRLGLVFIIFGFMVLSFKRGKFWQNSKVLFEQELRMDAQDPIALNNLGMYYNSMAEFSRAQYLLHDAVNLDRGNAVYLNNYGWALAGMGQTDSALVYFDRALLRKRNFISALNNMGVCYITKNDTGKAFYYFNSAYELNHENHETLYNMGAFYLKTGQKEKARPFIKRACELGNKSARKYLNY